MLSRSERNQANKLLGEHGLATLADPRGLLDQLAMGVTCHEQFARILSKLDPAAKADCYKALAPRLRFPAKPLDWYVAFLGQQAESQRRPLWDDAKKEISEFQPARSANNPPQQAAQDALWSGTLLMTCSRCTKIKEVAGETMVGAAIRARELGWRREDKREFCPKCAKYLGLDA